MWGSQERVEGREDEGKEVKKEIQFNKNNKK